MDHVTWSELPQDFQHWHSRRIGLYSFKLTSTNQACAEVHLNSLIKQLFWFSTLNCTIWGYQADCSIWLMSKCFNFHICKPCLDRVMHSWFLLLTACSCQPLISLVAHTVYCLPPWIIPLLLYCWSHYWFAPSHQGKWNKYSMYSHLQLSDICISLKSHSSGKKCTSVCHVGLDLLWLVTLVLW